MSLPLNNVSVGDGQVNAVKISYEWTIDLSKNSSQPGEYVYSPIFSVKCNKEYKWRLQLYPKGELEAYQEYISVFLCSYNPSSVEASFKFSILNNKNEAISSRQSTKARVFSYKTFKCWGFGDYAKRNFIMNKDNDVLKDGKLTILCNVILDLTSNNQLNVCNSCRMKEFDDFEKLLNNKEFSDVTFTVDGKQLYGHKSILTIRSPVFAGMFRHNMIEKNQNAVLIEEIDYKVFLELLRYIYAGKVKEIENIAHKLIAVADRYSIEGLKTKCEEILCENLSIDNALECLYLGDLYTANTLKAEALTFIASRKKEIIEKPDFKLVGEMHSNLVIDLFRTLVCKEDDK